MYVSEFVIFYKFFFLCSCACVCFSVLLYVFVLDCACVYCKCVRVFINAQVCMILCVLVHACILFSELFVGMFSFFCFCVSAYH